MPLYTYACPRCGTTTQLHRAIRDRDLPAVCPAELSYGEGATLCRGTLTRSVAGPTVVIPTAHKAAP